MKYSCTGFSTTTVMLATSLHGIGKKERTGLYFLFQILPRSSGVCKTEWWSFSSRCRSFCSIWSAWRVAGEGVSDRDPRADWIGEALSEPVNAIFNSYLKSLFYFLELLKRCLNTALTNPQKWTTSIYHIWAREDLRTIRSSASEWCSERKQITCRKAEMNVNIR